MSKILFKTGLYSDFAKDVFNDVQKYVQENEAVAVSYDMYRTLSVSGISSPAEFQFQHFDDGEVILRDPPSANHFVDTRKNSNVDLALQLKRAVCMIAGEDAWKRYDLNTDVSFYEKTYPVGGLYFIYDFLLNHRQSIDVFKRMHPLAAVEILGTQIDPIASEVNAVIRQKVEMVWNEFNEAVAALTCYFPSFCKDTPAEVELKARVTPIMDAFRIELEARRKALEESRDKKLAEIEKFKRMQVSNPN